MGRLSMLPNRAAGAVTARPGQPLRLMLVITRGDELGGAQAYVRDLAIRLVRDGHDVLVVVGSEGALTDSLAAKGVAWVHLPELVREIQPRSDWQAVRRLTDLIRSEQPWLVSAHSSKAGIVARLAARRAGVPCVFTVHGWAFNPSEPWPKRQIYRAIERGCAPLSARIICVSEDSRQRGIRAGLPSGRMVTIHNGIPDISPDLRATPGMPGPLRVAAVARLAPPKDPLTIVRALAGLDGVHVDFIGDGPLLPEARQVAAELGVEDRVRFIGQRDDVPALLAQSHVFVLSSRSEGFPISTLEAMRAGLPVIVSAVGGAPEAVMPEKTGFVVPPGDPAALRECVRRLATDPDLRARMGEAGRCLYEERFTFDRMYEATVALYAEVAASSMSRVAVADASRGHDLGESLGLSGRAGSEVAEAGARAVGARR